MNALGVSTLEISRRCGVPQSSLSRFLAGKTLFFSSVEKLLPIIFEDHQWLKK